MTVDSQNHSHWLKEGESRPVEFFIPLLQKQIKLIPLHQVFICPSEPVPPANSSPRQHPFPYMQFVVEGELSFSKSPVLDQASRITLMEGDGAYSPPNGWDCNRGETERTLLSIALYPAFISVSLTRHCPDPQKCFRYYYFTDSPDSSITQISQVMDRCILKKSTAALPYLTLSLLSIFCGILNKEPLSSDSRFLWRMMWTWILEHAHAPIDRKDVADAFKITEDHVSRIFRQCGEDSFHQTLEKIRMEKATWLLRDPQYQIKWIAQNCGYQNTDSFSRAFKRRYGVSPKGSNCR